MKILILCLLISQVLTISSTTEVECKQANIDLTGVWARTLSAETVIIRQMGARLWIVCFSSDDNHWWMGDGTVDCAGNIIVDIATLPQSDGRDIGASWDDLGWRVESATTIVAEGNDSDVMTKTA